VHCAHIGRPIAGDRKYGDKQFNREMKQAGLTRLFLHASRLGFRHPATGERIQVESALPAELSEVLDRLSPCPDA
jgi:23S rRNA pseudouridine955/2504/2580 synthase